MLTRNELDTCYSILEKPKYADLLDKNDFTSFFMYLSQDFGWRIQNMIKEFLWCELEINFMEYMQEIPAYLFRNANYIQEITIPSNIIKIGTEAFSGSSVTNVFIEEGTRFIGDGAFKGCQQLKEIAMPNTVEQLGRKVFNGDTQLETVFLSEILTTLPYQTFSGCTKLDDLFLPDSVKELDVGVFDGCTQEKPFVYLTKREPGNRIHVPEVEIQWYKQHMRSIANDESINNEN